jgi:hypothetical protein
MEPLDKAKERNPLQSELANLIGALEWLLLDLCFHRTIQGFLNLVPCSWQKLDLALLLVVDGDRSQLLFRLFG